MMPKSKNGAIEVAREARGPQDHVNFHKSTCFFDLSCAISLIVSLTLPSWSPASWCLSSLMSRRSPSKSRKVTQTSSRSHYPHNNNSSPHGVVFTRPTNDTLERKTLKASVLIFARSTRKQTVGGRIFKLTSFLERRPVGVRSSALIMLLSSLI